MNSGSRDEPMGEEKFVFDALALVFYGTKLRPSPDPLASPSSVATRESSNKFGFSLAAPSVAWCFLLKSGLRPAVRLRRLSPVKLIQSQDVARHLRLVLQNHVS